MAELRPITVQYDEASFNRMMQPILDEVNSQRRRIVSLEKTVGELQKQLLRMADDGK